MLCCTGCPALQVLNKSCGHCPSSEEADNRQEDVSKQLLFKLRMHTGQGCTEVEWAVDIIVNCDIVRPSSLSIEVIASQSDSFPSA